MEVKREISRGRQEELKLAADTLRSALSEPLQLAMDLAQEKGASTWLTSLPLEEFGFSLHKGAFRDALALRYGWLPQHTPTHCACGTPFSIEHVLSCPKGGGGGSHLSGIMRSGTLSAAGCLKYAMRCALNPHYSLSLENLSPVLLQIPKTVLDLTLLQMGSGVVAMREPTWM